jgi:heme A synthase
MDADSIMGYNQKRMEVDAANPITAVQIGLQLAHRIGAILVFLLTLSFAWLSRLALGKRHPIARISLILVGLTTVQILLGAATIWTGKSADIATAHVAFGALSLMTGSLLAVLSWHCLAPSVQHAEGPAQLVLKTQHSAISMRACSLPHAKPSP